MKSIVFIFVLSLVLLLSINSEQTCIETDGEVQCYDQPISPLNSPQKVFLPIIFSN